MVDIYRLNDIGVTLGSGARILKSADREALDASRSIIEAAHAKAEDITALAREQYESEKQRGFREGQEEAAKAAMENLLAEQAQLDASLAALEGDIAAMVDDLVRKAVGDISDSTLSQELTRSALKKMRREKRVQLHVAPSMVDQLQKQVAGFVEEFPEIELIDVVADPQLSSPDVILVSELGRVSCVLDDTLDQLGILLQKAVASSG